MFSKNNIFKQFRKNDGKNNDKSFYTQGTDRMSSESELIWNDSEESVSISNCDMDEDEYFGGVSFLSDSSGKQNLDVVDWNNEKCYYSFSESDEAQQSQVTGSHQVNIRKGNYRNTEKPKSGFASKFLSTELLKSPPPSKEKLTSTNDSPMLKFLSKKCSDVKTVSPDLRINSTTDNSFYNDVTQNNVNETFENLSRSPICADENLSTNFKSEIDFDSKCQKTDRIEKLYIALRNEASKFSEWKRYINGQIMEKNVAIKSAESTIENLRKSNLELQMNLENISLKYSNELDKRELVSKQIAEMKLRSDDFIRFTDDFGHLRETLFAKILDNNKLITDLNIIAREWNSQLDKHCYKCGERIERLEDEVNRSIGEIDLLKQEIERKDEKICHLLKETDLQNSRHREEYILLLSDIDQLSTTNAELKEQLGMLANECKNAQSEIETKANEILLMKEQNNCLTADVESLLISKTRDSALLHRKTIQLMRFASKIVIANETTRKLRKINTNLVYQNENYKESIAVFEKKIPMDELEKSEKNRCIEEALRNIIERVKSNETNITNRDSHMPNQDLVQLEAVLHDLESELVLKDELLRANEETLHCQAAKILLLQNNCDKLESRLSSKITETEKLVQAMKAVEVENGREQSNMQSCIESLTEDKSKLTELLEKTNEDKEKYKEETINLRKILSEAEERIQILSSELDVSKNACERNEKIIQEFRMQEMKRQETAAENENKIKEKDLELQHMTTRISSLEKAIEMRTQKTTQLCQNVSDLTLQLEYARQELTSQKLKEKTLQDQLLNRESEIKISEEKNLKLIGDLRNEKQNHENKLEQKLQEKDAEIQRLNRILNNYENESMKKGKKTEKKLIDMMAQAEKMKATVKSLTSEKKELAAKLAAQEKEMFESNQAFEKKLHELELQSKKYSDIAEVLDKTKLKCENDAKKLYDNANEIARLRKIEQEFAEFKRQMLSNSPPASTQLPVEIESEVTRTPKSPAVSARLNSMAIMKTPQKTPRSILKQPGSASKRRRVFFAPQFQEEFISSCETMTSHDSTDSLTTETINTAETPPTAGTPDSKFRDLQKSDRVPNVRKTPSRKGIGLLKSEPKFDDKNTNWFDTEDAFELVIEN